MKTGSDRSGGNPWVNGKWAIARADGVHERWLGDVRRNKDERELFGGVRGSPVPNVEISCQLIPVRVGCGAGTGRCVHLDFNENERGNGVQDQIDNGIALTNPYRPRLFLPETDSPSGFCDLEPGDGS